MIFIYTQRPAPIVVLSREDALKKTWGGDGPQRGLGIDPCLVGLGIIGIEELRRLQRHILPVPDIYVYHLMLRDGIWQYPRGPNGFEVYP